VDWVEVGLASYYMTTIRQSCVCDTRETYPPAKEITELKDAVRATQSPALGRAMACTRDLVITFRKAGASHLLSAAA
jgi:hypothetical protein